MTKGIKRQKKTIIATDSEGWQLWEFELAGKESRLVEQAAGKFPQPIPRSFRQGIILGWNSRQTVCWLPPQKAFFHIIELPPCEDHEIESILELQLEQFSPLPLTEIAWSFRLLPSESSLSRYAIVVILPASFVMDCIGKIEQSGIYPDIIDFPWIMPLIEKPSVPDQIGLWLWAKEEQLYVLGGFWANKTLKHAFFVQIPSTTQGQEQLANLLRQSLWAGELEGWFTQPPIWQVYAHDNLTQFITQLLSLLGAVQYQFLPTPTTEELAFKLATYPPILNLLPSSKATEYKKLRKRRFLVQTGQFLFLIYLLATVGLLILANIRQFQVDSLRAQITVIGEAYTNAINLKTQLSLLQQQLELRFAALECLKAVSETLPPEMSLDYFQFMDGKTLTLRGTVPADRQERVTSFNAALSRYTVGERKLFKAVQTKGVQSRGMAPAQWTIVCELETSQSF